MSAPADTERVTMTHAEWKAEGARRFGPDMAAWRFACPVCRTVTSVKEWLDAGAGKGAVAFSCIGRYREGARDAFRGEGAGPCNYTGGGLLGLNPVRVTFPDGSHLDAFAFAEAA